MKINFVNSVLFLLLLIFSTSCKDIIFEEDISNKTVVLNAPANNSKITGTNVTFWWNEVDGAINYQLQVVKPGFDSAIVLELDTIISKNKFTESLLPANYQWRVKAKNVYSETEYTVGSFSMITDQDFSSKKVVLLQPENNANTNINTLEFKWEAVEGATEYRFEVWSPNTDGEQVHFQIMTQTYSVLTLPEGTYVWKVRAQNDLANTLYSTSNLIIDLTPPKTPVLVSPENNAIIENNELVFSWTRDDISGSPEFDSIYIYQDLQKQNLLFKDIAEGKTYTYKAETGVYYWGVKAFDKAGNESPESSIFKVNYTKSQ